MDDEERRAIRAEHRETECDGHCTCCVECGTYWPCESMRLLDELERVEAERDNGLLVRYDPTIEAVAMRQQRDEARQAWKDWRQLHDELHASFRAVVAERDALRALVESLGGTWSFSAGVGVTVTNASLNKGSSQEHQNG